MSRVIESPSVPDHTVRLDPRALDARSASERVSWRDGLVAAEPATPRWTLPLHGGALDGRR
jgi:hypothetical protein